MVLLTRAKQLGLIAMTIAGDRFANGLKKEAGCPLKLHNFAINLAQINHRIQTRLDRRLYNHPNIHGLIHPLNEEKAIRAGGFLLAELSIYTMAGAAVAIFEVQRRKKNKNALKDEQVCEELQKRSRNQWSTHLGETFTSNGLLIAAGGGYHGKQIEFHVRKQVEIAQKQLELAQKQVELAQKLEYKISRTRYVP